LSRLDADTAGRLARVALANVARPYPHKLDHLLAAAGEQLDHRRVHPAFFGSYDWHSAVHMHWSLARVWELFPELPDRQAIGEVLNEHLSVSSLAAELAYFRSPAGRTFERPYGWAWLLKLQVELAGTPWEKAVAPLAAELAARLAQYLQAPYPVRAGSHGNSAFACVLALDYARAAGDRALSAAIEKAAHTWYLKDRQAPLAYEPSLDDFLSPSLMEALLMQEVLPPERFGPWKSGFLPAGIGPLAQPPRGFDRADAKQVHLDGLSLSRAWCLRRLNHPEPAERHLAEALPHVAADYVGAHWLASFALLALTEG
jgi:hypothetical protein